MVFLLCVSCKIEKCHRSQWLSSLSTYLEPLRLDATKGHPGIPLEFAKLLAAEISLIHPLLKMGEVCDYGSFLCPSAILEQTMYVNL
jgi:hypothetical protein